ncbi:Nitrogen permease regulator 3 [Paramyrothecium foliicola]|nr:Nitrogen permease regulator 3 [Paramyrothecium foliicola]
MSCVNSDNLLAVALIINRSRDGPAFVFHYPPDVRPVNNVPEPPESGDFGDILLERLSQPAGQDVADVEAHKHRGHDDLMSESGSRACPWEHVAGFPTRDLAGILTPARSYHRRLFQLSLDPLYCVSYPIHVPENGRWKKPKKASKAKSSKSTDDRVAPPESESSGSKATEPASQDHNSKKEDPDEEKRASMTMFNLVFFLNPKENEVKQVVDSLYDNILKKVNKAYKYSQQHSDFVWKESKRILAAKEKAREEQRKMHDLWNEILQGSSLAASVHDIYEAISQNKIATLHLDTAAGLVSPSVQIPVPFYLADLPSEDSRDQQGLWLTTANTFINQDALEEPGFLDRNFALLLIDDEKKIVAELQTDRDATILPLVEFVRLSKPTTSFFQLAQSNILTLSQVRKYAQHFIFWRRAIAIPPLHARDVYIVSPNCDLGRLPADSQEWQRTFPMAPPLPAFLSELSTTPRSYKSHCPSKAYRPLWLQMLAWLMARGWTTQLCTFAYVVVWPEILYEVDYEIEAEELGNAAEDSTESQKRTEDLGTPMSPEESSPPTQAPSTVEAAAEKARLERIAQRAHRAAADKATAHTRKAVPVATAHPSVNSAPHLSGLTPHIILDAKKATAKESRYLAAIARRFVDDKHKSAWRTMCKYFDGRSALERIALQEDMKRKEVWALLTSMNEYMLCVRHW